MIFDAETGRQRLLRALVFTAVFSRHMFVWVTFRETLEEVIAGFEAAWDYFAGLTTAGMRIHGTIHARPLELFGVEEAPALLAAPTEPFDIPTWTTARAAGRGR